MLGKVKWQRWSKCTGGRRGVHWPHHIIVDGSLPKAWSIFGGSEAFYLQYHSKQAGRYKNHGIILAALIKSKAAKYPSTVSLVSVNPISCVLLGSYSRPKTAIPIIIVKNVKSVPSSAPSFNPCFATHAAHSARCPCMYTSISKGSLGAQGFFGCVLVCRPGSHKAEVGTNPRPDCHPADACGVVADVQGLSSGEVWMK